MGRTVFQQTELPNTLKPVVKPLSVGGVDSDTIEVITERLRSLSSIGLGQPESAVPLNSSSKVPDEYIKTMLVKSGDCVEGVFTLYTYETKNFFITNYDCARDYVLTAPNASLVLVTNDSPNGLLEPGTLIYTAPPVAGNYQFTVNGEIYPITVIGSYIEKPSFTFPVNDAVITTEQMSAVSTLFSCTGYQDTQQTSEWQIATDAAFTNIVETIVKPTNAAGPLNELTSPLLTNRKYYLRVRYQGLVLGWSLWSDTISFTIAVTRYPTVENQLIDPLTIDSLIYRFGFRLDMSDDGNTVIVGSPESGPTMQQGLVHIFKRSSKQTAFSLVKTITPNQLIGSIDCYGLGSGVQLADNGNLAFIYLSWDSTNNGSIFVFKTTVRDDPSTMTLLTSLSATYPSSNYLSADVYMVRFVVSGDGTTLAITGEEFYHRQQGTFIDDYFISIYKFENNTLSHVTDILHPPGVEWMDMELDMNDAGTRIVAVAAGDTGTTNSGLHVIDFVNSVWGAPVELPRPSNNQKLGLHVAISGNGNVIIASDINNHALDNFKWIYVYEKNGLNWSHVSTVIPNSPLINTRFQPEVIKLNFDGTSIFAGDSYTDLINAPPAGQRHGVVSIYGKNIANSQWDLLTSFIASYYQNKYLRFGNNLTISKDGSVAVIASIFNDGCLRSFI